MNNLANRPTTVLQFIRRYLQFSIAALTLMVVGILQFTPIALGGLFAMNVVSLALTLPLVYRMIKDVRSGKYGVDILAATAIISAALLNQPWAAIIVVIMLSGGEALEDFAGRRAQSELRALLDRAPTLARLLRGDVIVEVKVEEIKVDDVLEIRPGDTVPVDSKIIEGSTSVDESSLTGESMPQLKNIGDTILSGSVVVDGLIRACAIHTGEDSQYQQIIKLVRQAAESPSPFVRMADRYSIPFTIFAYVIAISMWVISGDPIRFLEVIIVASPCPLILAAPIAIISGMSRASRYGIIVKSGAALEKLASIKTIAFDKTGTLTHGTPIVDEIIVLGEHDESAILLNAASLEQVSNHVLANAIIKEAGKRNIKLLRADDVKEMAGNGMTATVNNLVVLVGHYKFMELNNVVVPKSFNQTAINQTATYVAIDNNLAGVISFKDELRKESKATLTAIRGLGIQRILMLSGDNEAAAATIANELGIKEYQSHLLPEDKLKIIRDISDQSVAFVGDGVNDAPVLTAASVGIALGAKGSTAASESADLVIMNDDLSYVAKAINIAKETLKIARQSIFIGIALSVGLMLIFATGKFSPVAGALIQEVVDVIVIFNSLRAHADKKFIM